MSLLLLPATFHEEFAAAKDGKEAAEIVDAEMFADAFPHIQRELRSFRSLDFDRCCCNKELETLKNSKLTCMFSLLN